LISDGSSFLKKSLWVGEDAINNWKGVISKVLQYKFYEKIKNGLWLNKFWSDSYCFITTGQTTLKQVKKYIES